jgi:hypothetical protein
MTDGLIDPVYLPFTPEEMRAHFNRQADKHVSYYVTSAERYRRFMDSHEHTAGIPISKARAARQVEKDERFWVATALKHLYDSPTRVEDFTKLLSETFGTAPPVEGLYSWRECVSGDLRLFFEACLPAPRSYTAWLRDNLQRRQLIPYVLDAADRKKAKALEGPTHVDALLLNADNGFALLIEAKVTSDISHSVSFDDRRNQIARTIDVMLERNERLSDPLCRRRPDRSLFALLTPDDFKRNPKSRLYGWLMNDYQTELSALSRDLPHRRDADWDRVRPRLGWMSYEEIEFVHTNACPWMSPSLAVRAA